jgi:hypothetical protein
VFSQLIASRGYGDEEAEEAAEVEMDEQGRRVRRSAYEPVTKRYVITVKRENSLSRTTRKKRS